MGFIAHNGQRSIGGYTPDYVGSHPAARMSAFGTDTLSGSAALYPTQPPPPPTHLDPSVSMSALISSAVHVSTPEDNNYRLSLSGLVFQRKHFLLRLFFFVSGGRRASEMQMDSCMGNFRHQMCDVCVCVCVLRGVVE